MLDYMDDAVLNVANNLSGFGEDSVEVSGGSNVGVGLSITALGKRSVHRVGTVLRYSVEVSDVIVTYVLGNTCMSE